MSCNIGGGAPVWAVLDIDTIVKWPVLDMRCELDLSARATAKRFIGCIGALAVLGVQISSC